jgi:hypothetical protein
MTFVDSVYINSDKMEFNITGFRLVDFDGNYVSPYRSIKVNGVKCPIEYAWFNLYNNGKYIKVNGEDLLDYHYDESKIFGLYLNKESIFVNNINSCYVGYIIPEYYRLVFEHIENNVDFIIDFILEGIKENNFSFDDNNLLITVKCRKGMTDAYESLFGTYIKFVKDGCVIMTVPITYDTNELSAKLAKYRLLNKNKV